MSPQHYVHMCTPMVLPQQSLEPLRQERSIAPLLKNILLLTYGHVASYASVTSVVSRVYSLAYMLCNNGPISSGVKSEH